MSDNLPLVSIVTVVYNGESYIKDTIKSVLSQTYQNIEYIIIDGGSTDGTVNIIESFDKQIGYWVSEPDRGIYHAMNKGIKASTGDIIGIINADDWYEKDAVESTINVFLQSDCDIVYADAYFIDPSSTSERKIRTNHENLHYKMSVFHPSVFIRSKLYDESECYDESLRISSDYKLLREFYSNDSVFCKNNNRVANMRIGGASAAWKIASFETFQVQKKYSVVIATGLYTLRSVRNYTRAVFSYLRKKI